MSINDPLRQFALHTEAGLKRASKCIKLNCIEYVSLAQMAGKASNDPRAPNTP
jgi:hypothetical protein